MKSLLEDNYDLMCYNSKQSKNVDEVNLVSMMGSSLMIVMFENNEIRKREVNTTRRLNIPILFINNSLYRTRIGILTLFVPFRSAPRCIPSFDISKGGTER
jgi:hypothetical protein